MPIEVRRLIFTMDELRDVVAAYVATQETSVPNGTLMDLKLTREDPVEFGVHLQARDGRQFLHKADGDVIAGAIIHYCMENGIPMSRRSKKTVKKVPQGITLDMVQGGTPKPKTTGEPAKADT